MGKNDELSDNQIDVGGDVHARLAIPLSYRGRRVTDVSQWRVKEDF